MDRTRAEQLMRLAQKEVNKAVDKGDFPFGAPSKPNMNPNYNVFEIAERAREKVIIEKDVLKENCMRQIEDAKIKLNIK